MLNVDLPNKGFPHNTHAFNVDWPYSGFTPKTHALSNVYFSYSGLPPNTRAFNVDFPFNICDVIKQNQSEVGNIDFEI